MMMTNGLGATVGTLSVQAIVNAVVYSKSTPLARMDGWETVWYIFAGYALVVAILFALVFRYDRAKEA